jgi:hypothetical protein
MQKFNIAHAKLMFTTSLLRGLAAAGSISNITARGVPGGFVLVIRVGLNESTLKAYRGKARLFRRLDAAAKYVKDLGLAHFEVEVSGWSDQSSVLAID